MSKQVLVIVHNEVTLITVFIESSWVSEWSEGSVVSVISRTVIVSGKRAFLSKWVKTGILTLLSLVWVLDLFWH